MDMDINVIDLVLGASLLYGLINGLYKGFFIEVASLLGLICGVYGAIHFSHFATSLIKQKVEWDEQYINIVAFAITIISLLILQIFTSDYNPKMDLPDCLVPQLSIQLASDLHIEMVQIITTTPNLPHISHTPHHHTKPTSSYTHHTITYSR